MRPRSKTQPPSAPRDTPSAVQQRWTPRPRLVPWPQLCCGPCTYARSSRRSRDLCNGRHWQPCRLISSICSLCAS